MDKFSFFDLSAFSDNSVPVSAKYAKDKKLDQGTKLEDEFFKFFYVHNLTPLFTNESRTEPIVVPWTGASSVIKSGGHANRLLKEFSTWLNIAMDNKAYERAVFKILRESRTWPGFLKQISDHLDYFPYIEENYRHNTWNIVYYDKDKSGTKVSKGI